MKKSIEEAEMQILRGNVERNELVSRISILETKEEKSLVDLNRMRHLKDEKEATVGLPKSEMEGLKHAIYEDVVEKEKLRKQVFQLKVDLKKKEDVFTTVDKKLKESNGSFWWNKNYSEKQLSLCQLLVVQKKLQV